MSHDSFIFTNTFWVFLETLTYLYLHIYVIKVYMWERINGTIFFPLWDCQLIWYSLFQLNSFAGKFYNFLFFPNDKAIFYFVYMPHFHFSLFYWWQSKMVSFPCFVNSTAINWEVKDSLQNIWAGIHWIHSKEGQSSVTWLLHFEF